MLANKYRTDYVFTTNTGKLYDDKNVSVALNRYYKRIGVECKPPHTYRHTEFKGFVFESEELAVLGQHLILLYPGGYIKLKKLLF